MTGITPIRICSLVLLLAGAALAAQPELQVDATVNLESFPAEEEQAHIFHITNTGDAEVVLGGIRSNCSCVISEWEPQKLAPGDTAELAVRLAANSLSGDFSKILYVETDLPSRRFLRLTLKGHALPMFEITPRPAGLAGEFAPGESFAFEYRIKPLRKNLRLTAAGAAADPVPAEDDSGDYLLILSGTAPADPGYHELSLQLIAGTAGVDWHFEYKIVIKTAESRL